MHDPRIGRFFAIDPLAPEYPHNVYAGLDYSFETKEEMKEWIDAENRGDFHPFPLPTNSTETLVDECISTFGHSEAVKASQSLDALIYHMDEAEKKEFASNHVNTVVLHDFDLTNWTNIETRREMLLTFEELALQLATEYPDADIRLIEIQEDGTHPTELKYQLYITVGNHNLDDLHESAILRNIAKKEGYTDAYIMTILKSIMDSTPTVEGVK